MLGGRNCRVSGCDGCEWGWLESLLHYLLFLVHKLTLFQPVFVVHVSYQRNGNQLDFSLVWKGKNNCFEHQLFHVVSCKRCIYCCICQSISELVGNVPKSKRLQKKCSNFKCVPKVSRFHQSSSVIPPYQSLIATGFASRWPGCKWDINQNGTIYSYNHDGCKL